MLRCEKATKLRAHMKITIKDHTRSHAPITHRQKSTVKSTQNQSNRTNLVNVCSPFSDTPSPSPHLSDTTESGLPIIQEESLYRATPPRRGTGNLVP